MAVYRKVSDVKREEKYVVIGWKPVYIKEEGPCRNKGRNLTFNC